MLSNNAKQKAKVNSMSKVFSWAVDGSGSFVICHKCTQAMYAIAPSGIVCPIGGASRYDLIDILEAQLVEQGE